MKTLSGGNLFYALTFCEYFKCENPHSAVTIIRSPLYRHLRIYTPKSLNESVATAI